MNTKLTLRLDEDLIRRAKAYADRSGRSVSGLVADYFAVLTSDSPPEPFITPRVRRLLGALEGGGVDEEDYKRHLIEKYG
jgi:hypothetical protein